MSKKEQLEKLYAKFANCQKCPLAKNRNKIVFGGGNYEAKIMIIGEAPGAEEDLMGEPFIGRSGKFLREQMNKAGINTADVFFTNTVKCRPPNNRLPKANETNICMALILLPQIDIIEPKIIVTVGNHATKHLKSLVFDEKETEFKMIALPHPAYVIRTPKALKKFQETLIKIASEADKT